VINIDYTDYDDSAAWAHQIELENRQFQETQVPKVNEMISSKFLRKEDFDEDQVCTIKGVELETLNQQSHDQKWVMYFKEHEKGMVLNTTTIRVLEQAFGDDSDHWIGKRVMVYVDPNVSFQGKIVGGLRIRTPKKGAAPPKQEKQPEPAGEFDDDIPF
jgi:hypothetical protein